MQYVCKHHAYAHTLTRTICVCVRNRNAYACACASVHVTVCACLCACSCMRAHTCVYMCACKRADAFVRAPASGMHIVRLRYKRRPPRTTLTNTNHQTTIHSYCTSHHSTCTTTTTAQVCMRAHSVRTAQREKIQLFSEVLAKKWNKVQCHLPSLRQHTWARFFPIDGMLESIVTVPSAPS